MKNKKEDKKVFYNQTKTNNFSRFETIDKNINI